MYVPQFWRLGIPRGLSMFRVWWELSSQFPYVVGGAGGALGEEKSSLSCLFLQGH